MTKAKEAITYYGRIAHDVDVDELRQRVKESRVMLERLETLLDRNLTHEEAVTELAWLWDRSRVLLDTIQFRPLFLSHLIGRLLDDGVTISALATKVGVTRQKIHDIYYNGPGGKPTTVPRKRKTPAV